ncbi:hypothetical protein AUC43_19775 [Hymenobacter sedentarius]|uniref:ABC transporter ATP-binding protein n=1 Tax=Hymenobacter sedentarius TaxID=1411621 RepID=A0A0U4B224_9BACT|nr:hypothetical protein AUC43_19775 [Hymenobacter sedentarius]
MLLAPSEKRRGAILFFLLLINSFLDVFGLAALVPVIMVASNPKSVLESKYFFTVYQYFNYNSEVSFITHLIIFVFVFFLIKNLYSTWTSYLQTEFTADVSMTLIERQMTKYLNLPFWYFNDLGSSNIANFVIGIPANYVTGILRPLLLFLSEVIVITIIVVGIVVYKPVLLFILGIVLVPTAILTYRALRARSFAIGNRMNDLRPVVGARQLDLFIGYAELKLANKLEHFRTRITSGQREIQKLDAEAYLYAQLPLKVIELVAILGVVTILLYALHFTKGASGLIGLVGLFAAAAYRLMPSINRMLTALMQIKQHQYAIHHLGTYEEPHFNEGLYPQQLPLTFNDSIKFEQVGFTFPHEKKPALSGITLRINKGERVGFIGSSGAGKTTLMNLLLRFYREQEGCIRIDGQPLTPQHLQAWHRLVGYVKQDAFLMEASIKDNITLDDPNPDQQRLEYALEQASLRSFVDGLPNGVDTFIGERGSKLSGGQRQRIGIARALYKQMKVLVLDEATSALDNETEREVNEAINKLSSTDITILIIAHRITTLRECNRIYELSGGQLIGEHQYEDLIRQAV